VRIYYDTGVLVKLYTPEPESPSVRRFVVETGQTLPFLSLHRSECASAFHLKAFRGECSLAQANRALADIAEDVRTGLLTYLQPDWEFVWQKSVELTQAHSANTGCRTLDVLHVAAAVTLGFREFATSDIRQFRLAAHLGLAVHNPTA
jgi:predicted nucleic acid-binding protein